jgi:hypothetical protein
MALTTEQKASFLFKQAQGVAETSVTRDFFEEPRKGPTLVLNDQIWAQSGSIPTTAPVLADGQTSGVVQRFIDRTMTAVAGVSNSFYLADLVDAIPFNFGDGSYNYALKDSSGNTISFGQGDWLVENTGGVLTFYGVTPGNMPPKISFYKYVGTKGISGGGSGVTSVNGDSGPAVVLTTGNIPEGSNLYFTDGRAQTAVVTSDTSGAQTNLAPSIAALKTYVASQLAASSVSSVNGLTGAVVLTTTDIGEGTNLYFTDARAEAAAVVDSTSGSQTTKAASVAAMKAYVAAQSAPVTSVNSLTGAVLLDTNKIPEGTGSPAAWSTTGNMLTQKGNMAGTGQQNAALAIGGLTNTLIAITDNENFNGSTWVLGTALPAARSLLAAVGIQTATIAFGGRDASSSTPLNTSQIFNGSAWSSSGNLSVGRTNLAGAGTQSAALAFGGNTTASTGYSAVTDSFNGSTWASTGNLSVARQSLGGAGTQSAALAFGGLGGSGRTDLTEKFNGSTWSSTGNLLAARTALAGAGTQNSAILFGGNTGAGFQNTTELFNGSIWAASVNMSAARNNLGGAGTQNASLAFGGYNGSVYLNITEKYAGVVNPALYFTNALARTAAVVNSTLGSETDQAPSVSAVKSYVSSLIPSPSINSFDSFSFESNTLTGNITFTNTEPKFSYGFWVANVDTNAGLGRGSGAGVLEAAIIFPGGMSTSVTPFISEKFNGNQWSTSTTMTTERIYSSGCGSQNSSIVFAGYRNNPSFLVLNTAEKYDGNAFSSTGNLTNARYYAGGSGVQNACLSAGGNQTIGTPFNTTELFNGKTWSAAATLNTARVSFGMCGSVNATIAFTGFTTSVSNRLNTTEIYNGYTWINSQNYPFSISGVSATGTQYNALGFGGSFSGTPQYYTSKFNGYTWLGSAFGNQVFETNAFGSGNMSGYGGSYLSQTSGYFIDELECGFEAVYEGSTNSIQSSSKNSSLNMNLGAQSGYLQISLTLDRNSGLNSLDKLQISQLQKESSVPGIWEADSYINTARYGLSSAGQQNSSLAMGGYIGTGVNFSNAVESYNGLSWSNSSSLPAIRSYGGGCGVQNAALYFGGRSGEFTNVFNTYKYNGSTWSTSGSMNSVAYIPTSPFTVGVTADFVASCGTQNAAIAIGGSAGAAQKYSQKFNGSYWTLLNNTYFGTTENGETGSVSDGMTFVQSSAVGQQNSALLIAGWRPSRLLSSALKFNGNYFYVSSVVNTPRRCFGASGTSNSSLIYGGSTSASSGDTNGLLNPISGSEKFNGETWVTSSDMGQIKTLTSGTGLQNASISFGGWNGSASLSLSEKFGYSIKYSPATNGSQSAWSASTAISTATYSMGYSGLSNSSLIFGGFTTAYTSATLKYNGTTWSSSGNLSVARSKLSGCGTQNATVACGGETALNTATNVTELFNGSTWSTSVALFLARKSGSCIGTQYSCLAINGANGAGTSFTGAERFNGSVWASSSISLTIVDACIVGNTSAYLGIGGTTSPSGSGTALTSFFSNSTTPSAGRPTLPRGVKAASVCGTINAALVAGGVDTSGGTTNLTLMHNGSYAYTGARITNNRSFAALCGTKSSALLIGGEYSSTPLTSTERYIENIVGNIQYG